MAFLAQVSTQQLLTKSITTATIDASSTITAPFISSLSIFVSSINGLPPGSGGGGITTSNLQSTVEGLGTAGYISTAGGGITTSNLQSTVAGLGTAGYISTAGGGGPATIPNLLSTFGVFTSSLVASTITASTIGVSSLTANLGTFVTLSSQALLVSSFYSATSQLTPMFIVF